MRPLNKIFPSLTSRFAGYSLIEVLVALAVTGVVAAAVTHFVGNVMQQRRIINLQLGKSRIIAQLEEVVANPNLVRAAIEYKGGPDSTNNMKFAECLTSGAVCGAGYTRSSAMKSMDFSIPDGSGGYLHLSEYWSAEGAPNCLPPTADSCPFKSQIKFWFSCPVNRLTGVVPATCSAPPYVNFIFTLEPTEPNVQTGSGFSYYHPGDKALVTDPERSAMRMATKDIVSVSQECGAEHYMAGLDPKGNIICKCLSNKPRRNGVGTILTDSLGRPLCGDNRCANNETLIGYEKLANGDWNAVCVDPNDAYCYDINIASSATCAEGFALTSVDFGKCNMTETGTKKKSKADAGDDIDCAADSGKCCKGRF